MEINIESMSHILYIILTFMYTIQFFHSIYPIHSQLKLKKLMQTFISYMFLNLFIIPMSSLQQIRIKPIQYLPILTRQIPKTKIHSHLLINILPSIFQQSLLQHLIRRFTLASTRSIKIFIIIIIIIIINIILKKDFT